MSGLWHDIRFAARMVATNRGLTLGVVLTLALGVGANSGIFSLLDAALLRPLPVRDPDQLVNFQIPAGGGFDPSFNYPLYTDYRDRNTVLEGLIAYGTAAFSLTAEGESERVGGTIVSGNFFDVLGVQPSPGRGFLPEEDRTPDANAVVVISHGLWQRRFGGDLEIVGREIALNGRGFTIVGVAPRGFGGVTRGFASDLYVPMMMYSAVFPGRLGAEALSRRTYTWLQMIGRLKPGVSLEQAQAAMGALAVNIAEVEPTNTATDIVLSDGSGGYTGLVEDLSTPLLILQLIVGLVLLIACANVANLLLNRALVRRREMAIRLALGASRWRLARQLLAESLLLAALGGLVGLLVAPWVVEFLLAFRPWPTFSIEAGLDSRVLAFSLGVTMVTGIVFGLAPALQAPRRSLLPALKDDTPAAGSSGAPFLRSGLVVTQLALSITVLVAAGLSLRSLYGLYSIPTGFEAEKVLLMSVDLGRGGYDEERGARFFAEMLERVRSLPGVEAAGIAPVVPLTDSGMRITSQPEGHVSTRENPINLTFNAVSPGWFASMGIPFLSGRDFGDRDDPTSGPVAIVNEAFVAHYWPGHAGLGKRIELSPLTREQPQSLEVVGVVGNSRYRSLTEDVIPTMYLPFAQNYRGSAVLFVRAANPEGIVDAARGVVRALDPGLPVYGVRTLAEQRTRSLSTARLAATLLSLLGVVALLLAAVGIYGVLAYSVARRTREIGVRVALGARPRDILTLVLGQGAKQVALGLALGLAGAFAAVRLLQSTLYGVGPYDPASFVAAAAVLAVVALWACYIPARRAVRVDPMTALRHE